MLQEARLSDSSAGSFIGDKTAGRDLEAYDELSPETRGRFIGTPREKLDILFDQLHAPEALQELVLDLRALYGVDQAALPKKRRG